MEAYIKESIYVLDYQDNVVDAIFISDDHRTPGYAYSVNIEDANTGYSNLSFTMPNYINDETGNSVINPKLKLLTPLVKLRYRREVYYRGIGDKETINTSEPNNLGEYGIFQAMTYPRTNEPDGMIEDYIMDYIVQPTQKNRSNLEISTQFNAIDYPRFNLSKKHFGLTFADESVTHSDWSIYDKTPMSIPGTIKYIKWDASKYGAYSQVEVWDPANATQYPLTNDDLDSFLQHTELWSYGVAATVFYWPTISTARYDGILYNADDYLTLTVYPKMLAEDITDPDIIETTLDRYTATWNQLIQNRWYLTPNNACNYLLHILETTNWTIKNSNDRYDGTYTTSTQYADEDARIAGIRSLISSAPHNVEHYVIVKEFKTHDGHYKDTLNRKEDLPSSANKDDRYFILTKDSNNKIINTVMYVWDGTKWYEEVDDKDYCRTSFWTWDTETNRFEEATERAWTSSIDKKTGVLYDVDPCETEVATPEGSSEHFEITEYRASLNLSDSNCYNAITALCKEFQLYPIFDCINRTVSLKQFAGKNYGLTYRIGSNINSDWVKADGEKVITKLRCYGGIRPDGSEQINLGDANRTYIDDGVNPDTLIPWDPNNPKYIAKRSPYGTEYVYNFKWMYDNGWMTKQQILDLYALNQQINDKNKDFLATYAENFTSTNDAYVQSTVAYDANNEEFLACLNSMANTYYKVPSNPSMGKFTAFPYAPKGTELRDGKYYVKMYHCYACGYTHAGTAPNRCPNSGCKAPEGHIEQKYVYIPVFDDFRALVPGDAPDRERPQSKGFYQAILEQLGTTFARNNISIVDLIQTAPIDNLTDEKKFIIAGQEFYDKSGNLYNWNDYVSKWQEYYGYMLDYQRSMENNLQRCKDLEVQYNIYADEIQAIEDEIQDRFGDYIVEGKYKDEEIAYEAILLNKSLEASDKYCIPQITYNLNVIDTTGMIEYRRGVPAVCNDIVNVLNNVGQIVPHVGDYCAIFDERMGLTGQQGLITNIKRILDDPKSNTITLDTAYHDADELVGNIINATNTVLNHSDVYARTAILNTDGTIAGSALADSLEKSLTDNISIVGVKGSSLLDSNGLTVTDPKDAERKLKYTGAGVYGTVDNGATWQSMMTPDGINANYINAGSIDTKNIQIMSGRYGKVVLDSLGFAVKDNPTLKYTLPTTVDSDGFLNWSNTNLKAFLGVNRGNEGLLYLNGQMQITGGSKIGNWVVGEKDLYNSTKKIYLSPDGVDKTILSNTDKKTFVAGDNFAVTTSGKLLATGADLTGKIVITDDNSEMNAGTIGGWTSTGDGLKKGQLVLSPSGNAITGTVYDSTERSDWGIYMNGKFGVTTNGDVYMTGAHIKGNIYADSGTFNGTVYASSGSFSGSITTTNLNASGTVTIGNARITEATITNSSIDAANINTGTLNSARIPNLSAGKISSGMLEIYNNVGFLKMGYASSGWTNHPYVSALNVASQGSNAGGISFRTSTDRNSAGNEGARIAYSSTYGQLYMRSSGAINTSSGGSTAMDSSGYLRLSAGNSGAAGSNTGSVYITASAHITIHAGSGGHVYAGANGWNGGSNAWVTTDKGDISSRSTKTNIKEMESEVYDDALKMLKNMKLYTYDYKYDLYDNKSQYGFILDEIEQEDKKHHFLDITNRPAWTRGRYINFDMSEKPENDKSVSVIETKHYDRDVFSKYLLTCIKALQNKIDELEKQIKKEETN